MRFPLSPPARKQFEERWQSLVKCTRLLDGGRKGTLGSNPTLSALMRGRAAVARQAHYLEVKGSIPFPATVCAGMADALRGRRTALRMR